VATKRNDCSNHPNGVSHHASAEKDRMFCQIGGAALSRALTRWVKGFGQRKAKVRESKTTRLSLVGSRGRGKKKSEKVVVGVIFAQTKSGSVE